MAPIDVQLTEAQGLNPLIRRLVLRAVGGAALPDYAAGAHVRVRVDLPGGASDWRHYSLVNPVADAQATRSPTHYVIAVRREDEGRGGSRFMHGLPVGARLQIEPPKNDFPLPEHPGGVVLVAGGIGVTPLLSMAAELRAAGRPVRMVYAGRSRDLLAFLPELQALLGDALTVHADAETGAPLDVGALLDGCAADERIFMCGPKPMLDAVLAGAHARGWPPERVHFELFTAAVPEAGDRPFEVVLAQSGASHTVAADQSILDCLIEHGCDPLFDCKRGECGVCAVPVIEGEIDHRDYVLTASEKAAGNVIQICISRARGQRLVLDL
jgi:vanillate O-demethylase ferredoxin subunit